MIWRERLTQRYSEDQLHPEPRGTGEKTGKNRRDEKNNEKGAARSALEDILDEGVHDAHGKLARSLRLFD